MTDCLRKYRADQLRSRVRTLTLLRGESVERTLEEQRADAAVDEMLARMIAQPLTDKQKQELDLVWWGLEAEAAFTLPGLAQIKLLARAARELVERDVDAELAGGMLDAFAATLGLGPPHVRDALAEARA